MLFSQSQESHILLGRAQSLVLPIVLSNDMEIDREPHVQSIQNKPQELHVYSRRVGQTQKPKTLVTILEHCQEFELEVNTKMNEAGSGPKETRGKKIQSIGETEACSVLEEIGEKETQSEE